VEEIIIYFGGKSQLAKALSVDPAAVSQWLSGGYIPPRRAIEIEIKSNGKFKAIDTIRRCTHAND